jgi:hypothetical protein
MQNNLSKAALEICIKKLEGQINHLKSINTIKEEIEEATNELIYQLEKLKESYQTDLEEWM